MTPLVGQLVVDVGADSGGIRAVNGEVERFDARTVIRWSPLAPQRSPAAKHPHDWEDVGHTYRNLARSVTGNRLRAGRVPF